MNSDEVNLYEIVSNLIHQLYIYIYIYISTLCIYYYYYYYYIPGGSLWIPLKSRMSRLLVGVDIVLNYKIKREKKEEKEKKKKVKKKWGCWGWDVNVWG